MYLTKLEDEMKLMIESILGILDGRPPQFAAETLWKFWARDLLKRIDREILPRDGATPAPQPPRLHRGRDVGSERDAAGTPMEEWPSWR